MCFPYPSEIPISSSLASQNKHNRVSRLEPRGFEPLTSAVQKRHNTLLERSVACRIPANSRISASALFLVFQEIHSGTNKQTLTGTREAGSSIDLEPNACAAVLLYSPAVRYRLDDRQAPPTLQARLRARFRRHLEARARIAYPPHTEPAETLSVSEMWSFGESPAWRILLVTSSLTTSRTSSSFSGGKRSASRSRVWRAVVTTSGSGASLRSISASINKSRRPTWQALCTLATRYYTAHGCAATLLEKGGGIR